MVKCIDKRLKVQQIMTCNTATNVLKASEEMFSCLSTKESC